MHHSGNFKQTPANKYAVFSRSLVSAMLLAALSLYATIATANTHSADCKAEYARLYKQYSGLLENHAPQSDGFYKAIHGVENTIFTAFQACPNNPLLFSLMGEVQLSLGNIQLAALYAKRAHHWEPEVWQTNHLLGTTFLLQDNYQQALPYLKKAADLAEHKADLRFNLCNTYLNTNQYEKTVACCTRLLQQDDHDLKAETFHLRAQAHRALNKNRLATQDFNQAKELGFEK